MQSFKNIEDLVDHMFEKLYGDEPVSVVADKDLAVDIMSELLNCDGVILNFANVDAYEYDKEYLVSLQDDTDTDYWHVNIEQIYNYEKEKYFGTDGYVLFHEDVNSKALVNMQNNENIELSGYDWFTIGEDDGVETEDNSFIVNGKNVGIDEYNAFVSKFAPDKVKKSEDKLSASSTTYRVNGKNVGKDEYDKAVGEIENKYLDNIMDMLSRYTEFIDECEEWRKLLRW